MVLTVQSAKSIKSRDMIKFSWTDGEGKNHCEVGVVYENNESGIKMRMKGGKTMHYTPIMFNGSIEFQILNKTQ